MRVTRSVAIFVLGSAIALIMLFDLFSLWAIVNSYKFLLEYLTALQGATLYKQIVVYWSVGVLGTAFTTYAGLHSAIRIYNTIKAFGIYFFGAKEEE
jgi:hypothetical protein